ncbi:MAG: magnesium transporter [Desulfobacteraceae bacterium]|nr:magnesium transporter [Desulfobacteraceae bacterium]
MVTDQTRLMVDSIKRLLRRNAYPNLKNIVSKTHAADLSIVFGSLASPEQSTLFNMIEEPANKGLLLKELEEDIFLGLVSNIPLEEVVNIFKIMPSDDVAELVNKLPEDTANTILKKMRIEDSQQVAGLLSFADKTAGRIMITDYIALADYTTAKQAIESLQKEHCDVEMPFYLYVVDDYEILVGVISLRQLVVVPPDTPLKKFMVTDVFSVSTDTDQEEVAKIVARYDILAVPVVDSGNRLVGIITVDDVIDIFRSEATKDILKMAGAGEEYVETKSVLKSTRIRLPWLFASCVGGIIAVTVIGSYESALSQLAFLAAFIPVIMGMGGNIGTQSSTIVVRGLATGRLNYNEVWIVVSKELCIGLILGLIYGAFIATVAQFRYDSSMLALSVGLSLISSMTIAALVGSLVPMIMARINIDPAVATGPFVTTAIDIVSVFFYFSIATYLLGI